MKGIEHEFYTMLAEDYHVNEENSVVYMHYENELKEFVSRNSKNKGKTGLPAAAYVYREYSLLGADAGADEVFAALKNIFVKLNEHPELYDQPLYVRRKEDEKSKDGALNDRLDFEAILNVLKPFLVPAVMDEVFCSGLARKCKKTELKKKVSELCIKMEDDAESVTKIYEQKGLLKKAALETLYRHILKRSIDKSFKDYLYTYGYYMHRERSGDESEYEYCGNDADLNSKYFSLEKREGGRKGTKSDKTLRLLSWIFSRNSLYSLRGDNLENEGYVKAVKSLYRLINESFKTEKDVRLSLPIAADPYTGVTLNLLGNYYVRGVNYPCVFAVLQRYADEGSYSFEPCEEDDIIGPEFGDDAETAFAAARAAYIAKTKAAFDEISGNNSLYGEELEKDKKGAFKYFRRMFDAADYINEEELRAETLAFIDEKYEDETD